MSDLETTLIEFRSDLGNSILHPSDWIAKSKANAFSISAPNGQAVISGLTFLREGSGTLREFGGRLVYQLTDVENSEWLQCQIREYSAIKWHSDVDDSEATSQWLVLVVECGDCYHAIIVEMVEVVAVFNWQFYEKLVQSFRGIESPPAAG